MRSNGELGASQIAGEERVGISCWVIKQDAIAPSMAGGIRPHRLAQALIEEGYRVTVLASGFSYFEHRHRRVARRRTWLAKVEDGVPFVWIRSLSYKRNDWRRVISMCSFAARLYRLGRHHLIRRGVVPRPDIIYASAVPPLAALTALRLAQVYRIPFVLEIGDLWPQTPIDMGILRPSGAIARTLWRVERCLVLHAARIVTPLPGVVDYLGERYGVSDKKVVWIPNGADSAAASTATAMRGRRTASPFTVMYVGAHGPANSLASLLPAAKLLQDRGEPDICFVLIGDGSEKQQLVEACERMKLVNVQFHNPICAKDVPGALAQADATILIVRNLPVYRFGIGMNKLFTYLAAGCPVLVVGEPRNNPVRDADAGVTIPSDKPAALAEAVASIARMPAEERQRMGERGRAHVMRFYEWSSLGRRLAETLEGLVECGRDIEAA